MKKFFLMGLIGLVGLMGNVRADVIADFHFEGTLGDKIGVSIEFAVNADYVAVGEIVYTNHKKPIRLLIVGTWTGDEYLLNEYKADGTVTGCLRMKIDDTTYNEPILTEGSWSNPKNGQVYEMKNMEYIGTSSNSFWDYGTQETIEGDYYFHQWDTASNSMVIGSASFRWAGDHKLNFEILNDLEVGYIDNTPGRPAELRPYTYNDFVYEKCSYVFEAHFFKNFVVLITASEPGNNMCGDKNLKIDGVYFKVKNEK
jgi:hypothetical protein